jgi:glycosyltransferase involved in cell wall biosynthesis
LVISDNASDDGTEEICRQFACSDARVRYHRQPRDIGLVASFNTVLQLAHGPYFKWGDDDWLTPTYVTRCVEVLDDDHAHAEFPRPAHRNSPPLSFLVA